MVHLARDNFQIKFFKLDSWSPGAGFFLISTINLLSVKRRRDSDFKMNFVIIKKKREKLKNFTCEVFPARYPCAQK